MDNQKSRCLWVKETEPLYVEYHDYEWGIPVYEDKKLFEMLILEGAQAGLSWWTVLQKRAHYRKVFNDFEAEKIIDYSNEKLLELQQDPGIIRNKLKIESVVKNARAYLAVQQIHGSFSSYIWKFIGEKPIVNNWKDASEVPVQTEESIGMSKQLKKDGFTFVGPTICYAFMQATGMVNDHTLDCVSHPENKKSNSR